MALLQLLTCFYRREIFLAFANRMQTRQAAERHDQHDCKDIVHPIVAARSISPRTDALHFRADDPMREIPEHPADRDEQPEDASAHSVWDGLHERGFGHGIAGHEEEAVNEEYRDHP